MQSQNNRFKTNNIQQISLSEDYKDSSLTLVNPNEVQGYKGWSTILSSQAIIEGVFYTEIIVGQPKEKLPFVGVQPHIRVGLSSSEQPLEMPIGSTKYSFCYRDLDGSIFNNASKKQYGKPYQIGDSIGILLYLSPRSPIRQPGMVNKNSQLYFFKNGECQGVAYQDLPQEIYYFGISLYMGASAIFKPGPQFTYPIHDLQIPDKKFTQKILPYSDSKNQITYNDIILNY